MFVHDQTPPGVAARKRLRKKLVYKVELTEAEGRVVIGSADFGVGDEHTNSISQALTPIQFQRSRGSWLAIVVIVAIAVILYAILH